MALGMVQGCSDFARAGPRRRAPERSRPTSRRKVSGGARPRRRPASAPPRELRKLQRRLGRAPSGSVRFALPAPQLRLDLAGLHALLADRRAAAAAEQLGVRELLPALSSSGRRR